MNYYPFENVLSEFKSSPLKTDIFEQDGYYKLVMEVSGIQKENIKIELKDGYLKITVTRKPTDAKIIRQERFNGTYYRSFYVGENVTQNDIKARFDNGELYVYIPTQVKKKEPTTQYITIK